MTAEHLAALWEAVADLPSFHHKLGFPKMGRWFSWNDSCHDQMPEFHATKMLLEHHLGNATDPDLDVTNTFDIDRAALAAAGKTPTPAAELAALKSIAGGMPLAFKLMSSSLQEHVKILYTVTNPCWDWYADQVKSVETPADGLTYSVRFAAGRWAKEPHLWRTIKHSLYDEKSLSFMGLPQDSTGPASTRVANKTLMLMWHILAHRGWSLSRHDVAPECFANVASSNPIEAQQGMASMRTSWRNLMMLEQRVHDVPAARQLWIDLDFAQSQAIRLMFTCFERDRWRPGSMAGRKLLSGLLCVLPDNKTVED